MKSKSLLKILFSTATLVADILLVHRLYHKFGGWDVMGHIWMGIPLLSVAIGIWYVKPLKVMVVTSGIVAYYLFLEGWRREHLLVGIFLFASPIIAALFWGMAWFIGEADLKKPAKPFDSE